MKIKKKALQKFKKKTITSRHSYKIKGGLWRRDAADNDPEID